VILYGGAILLSACWHGASTAASGRRRKPDTIRHVSPTKMPKVEGSEAVRRYREGGSRPDFLDRRSCG
jgi:hypothetical protein